ncbi:MAG: efflux RND transporter periplasmic adaptor subunit [Betaproteobacteria bacterium]|nr:efflux RND transporter periplasmic adaptor subunit [Betaproteobacteria bacterium]
MLQKASLIRKNKLWLKAAVCLAAAVCLSACIKGQDKADKPATSASLLLAAEDLHTVRSNVLASGPAITGSIQPERRADLRAEVSAVVLQMVKENGDVVRHGDLLVRLDDTAIRDSLAAAVSAVRSAGVAQEQAERQYQRMVTLRGSGMASTQQMEDAENRRNTTQSDLEAAKTREVLARQQLQRTEVRAPFDGLVSDRKASAGDTVQIGKELVKVIDPASMRFEGLVSADAIGSVRVGEQVVFRVNGYGDQQFLGKVRRVNPAANATTRQVEVVVDFADKKQPKLAGLYAEGRIESDSATSLTLPATAFVRDGDKAYAWRIQDNSVRKVTLSIGSRDERSGEYVLKDGLKAGDVLIRQATSTMKDGQKVEVAQAKAAATTQASK